MQVAAALRHRSFSGAAAHLSLNLSDQVWLKWTDSNSNPTDGLSRLGVEDPWTLKQGFLLHELQGSTLPLPSTDVFGWADMVLHWGSTVLK